MNLYPCSTTSFWLRNWDEEILDSFHILMLKLSFSRDMAKYLDSSICRGGALSPQALIFTKTGPFRSLPLDQNGRVPTYQKLPPTVHMAKFLQPIWSWQSPYCQVVALEASQHLTSQISLFLGGFPQVRYTRFTSPLALCNHSTKNHQASLFHPGDSLT